MLNRKYLFIGFILLGSFFQLLNAQTYQVGSLITNPDGSQGVVFFVHSDGTGGWMVALNDASTNSFWSTNLTDISTLTNINSTIYPGFYAQYYAALYDTAGYSNTQKIRIFQNNNVNTAAGRVNFTNDWYLPAIGQLLELYGVQPIINATIIASGGTILSSTSQYWSSTEYDASRSWSLNSNYGNSEYITKSMNERVRAVRNFSNQAILYDTTLTYLWSTGSTQPYITPSPTTTTTYTVTATSGIGCSNSVNQTIFVNSATPQTLYDTVCVGYPYQGNGFNILASENQATGATLHTRTVTQDSCQATVQLYLYKKPNQSFTINVSICQGEEYYLNGVEYYNSGTYIQNLNSVNGCDSTLTLHLTFNPSPNTVLYQTACNSFTWNGNTYTQFGDYTQTFIGQNGCDSTVTLELTLHQTVYSTLKDTTCSNQPYTGFGFNIPASSLTTTGTFYFKDTLTSQNGCDSIVLLILTIFGTPNITILATPEVICQGDTTSLEAIYAGSGTIYYPPVVAIGDILCTDSTIVKPSDWPVPGKVAKGVVFYVDNTGQHGWAVHLNDQSTGILWSTYYVDIPTLPNYTTPQTAMMDLDGYINTQIIRAFSNANAFPAAWIVDFANGWYLPAAGQLRKIYGVIRWVNPTLQIVGGTQFSTHLNGGSDIFWYYWSSTEYSCNDSWTVHASGELFGTSNRWHSYFRVRSVQSF